MECGTQKLDSLLDAFDAGPRAAIHPCPDGPRTVTMKPSPPALLLALALATLPAETALAKSNKTVAYRYDQVWSTAIRYLRADRGYRITDKDAQSGYVLFIYPGDGAVKECAASLEIMRVVDPAGYEKVRLQLVIAHQPSYIEVHFLDTLEQKLVEELGSPPPPSRARKPDDKEPGKREPEKKPEEPR
jgi:hypothetical protein